MTSRFDFDEERAMARVREQKAWLDAELGSALHAGESIQAELSAKLQAYVGAVTEEANRILHSAQHGPTIINLRPARYSVSGPPTNVDLKPVRVRVAPAGGLMLRIAGFLFSRKTAQNVYGQLVADMWEEHFAALKDGRPWKAGWVIVCGWWQFAKCLVAPIVYVVIGALRGGRG